MSKRFKTTRRGPLKMRHVLLIVLILITLLSIQGFLYVERNLEPALKEIARTYVKQIATLTITDAISKKITEDMEGSNQVAVIEKDSSESITLISFDQSKQARIITQVTDRANQLLMELAKEPIEIPLGQALNSNILAQLGPNVPITLVPLGAAKADIDVRMEEAGINVVSIEVYLTIEADVQIVIPFTSDEAVVTTEFPIEVHVLPGDVPNVYFKGSDGNLSPVPNVTIPTE
ncbi:sporulation protein YunB [Caldalkalibacillus salinus]|uniref:sporulation protein YunB n=1 Tax=Caldalkalibacillus salinus TaxID=2803787 RepID=UPI00192164A1|nr:sporulation protein YunB [Caldalkalibacillus salinus]